MQFLGYGVNDIDRVKIQIDDPNLTTEPPRPADIGATDFTLEFWMRTTLGGNSSPEINCQNYNWISGNILIDRDRFNLGRSFGLSLSQGELNFGIEGNDGFTHTVCSENNIEGLPNTPYPAINVDDGQWHHVALQRQMVTGLLWIYIDGQLRAKSDASLAALTSGDISYPDDGLAEIACYYGGESLVACDQSDPYLVLGAEKHDANPLNYPPYLGLLDELRISNILRYGRGADENTYSVPTEKFIPDNNTLALYHFDSNMGSQLLDAMGQSHGDIRFGSDGVGPTGPIWQDDDMPIGVNNSTSLVEFRQGQIFVDEESGDIQIAVQRSRSVAGTINLRFQIRDISTSSEDYTVVNNSNLLTWTDADGTDKTIIINITNDLQLENLEQLEIDLVIENGAVELGANSTFQLNINANDGGTSPPNNPPTKIEKGALSLLWLLIFSGLFIGRKR